MVQWAAGDRVTASKLSTTRLYAVCDVALLPTTSAQDISGLTLTFTTTRDNVDVHVIASCDVQSLGSDPDTGVVVIDLDVDGTDESQQLVWSSDNDAGVDDNTRVHAVQSWVITLASAGSHTLKLEALRIGGIQDDTRINATHSTLTATVEDNV